MAEAPVFRSVAVVSYRLGHLDGVSVEAAKWCGALEALGLEVMTVAGAGQADVLVEGLDAWAATTLDERALADALDDVDVTVVENVCSLPLNTRASDALARLLAGRAAVLHHHDLAWQRPGATVDSVPDDPGWTHVTINRLSQVELAARGIAARVLYNRFDPNPPPGRRGHARHALGIGNEELVFLQPTRAIPRKNVVGGLALAESFGARYWLTGPAEEGYGEELGRLLGRARVPVTHRAVPPGEMPDAYAAADVVMLPSHWEGFGNPAVEAALHRRPAVVGSYPVAGELRELGFRWFGLEPADGLADWLEHPDPGLLEDNRRTAQRHLSLDDLPATLEALLGDLWDRRTR